MKNFAPNSMEHLQQPPLPSAFSYSPLTQPTIPQPMPPQMEEKIFLKRFEVDLAICKESRLNDLRMDQASRKIQLSERARELRKAQYDAIKIKENGAIVMQTKNTLFDPPEREIVNFPFPDIFQLVSADENGEIYMLHLNIANKVVQVFLDGKKAGNPAYLLRKLTAAGGVIFTDRRQIRENFLYDFWSLVISEYETTMVIPASVGWMKNEYGKFNFIERGALLWNEVVQCAK